MVHSPARLEEVCKYAPGTALRDHGPEGDMHLGVHGGFGHIVSSSSLYGSALYPQNGN